MRLLITITFLLLVATLQAQPNPQKFYFPKIGMTVAMPAECKVLHATPDAKFEVTRPPVPLHVYGQTKPITDTEVINRFTVVDPLRLLDVITDNGNTELGIQLDSITYYSQRAMNLVVDSTLPDSIKYLTMLKHLAVAAARQASDKFDTLFSKLVIDGVNFDKIFTVVTIRGEDAYEGGYSAKIGNYLLFIKLFCVGKKSYNDMMHIIEAATFDKTPKPKTPPGTPNR